MMHDRPDHRPDRALPGPGPRGRLRLLAGLVLAGYALLVLGGVLPHDALVSGVVALVLAVPLLLGARLPRIALRRAWLVALLGAGAAGGVLLYNVLAGSGVGWPEAALLAYGLALLAAAPNLERRVARWDVATLVGWSFPLLLAPLAIFSANAVVEGGGAGAAAPLIEHGLANPLAAALVATGDPARVVDRNVLMATPRGTLALGIGMVCAGIYPMVLFLGVLGLHGWQQRMDPRRFALYLVLGLAGLWLANLVRLVALAKVGKTYGAEALQVAHAHLGWVLFIGFMLLFWGVVLRRLEPARAADDRAA